MIDGRNSKQKSRNSTKNLQLGRRTSFFYFHDMDKDTVRNSFFLIIFQIFSSPPNQTNYIHRQCGHIQVWDNHMGTVSFFRLNPTSMFFFINLFFFQKNLHRHWHKLNGDGEIVWGRAYFYIFNLRLYIY